LNLTPGPLYGESSTFPAREGELVGCLSSLHAGSLRIQLRLLAAARTAPSHDSGEGREHLAVRVTPVAAAQDATPLGRVSSSASTSPRSTRSTTPPASLPASPRSCCSTCWAGCLRR